MRLSWLLVTGVEDTDSGIMNQGRMSDSCDWYRVAILEFGWRLVRGGNYACLHYHWPEDSVCASRPLLFDFFFKDTTFANSFACFAHPVILVDCKCIFVRAEDCNTMDITKLWEGSFLIFDSRYPVILWRRKPLPFAFCWVHWRKQENGRRFEKSFTGGILEGLLYNTT